ncbi:hypothetical protein K432DRAFT_393313 [Lepidopterella palustris CBS 459.81]|uniref:Uncharacterized protein n=1 Tax=Lepidopterella palustris CBS 459.81 TaxID=1314670 RepID=A0A8E2EA80_9PEZI|nr:hypothetical protein K432DRAFT_393313 [Lepidopterella palustris CBS 459.81]
MCLNHRTTHLCTHTHDLITLCYPSLLPLVRRATLFPYTTPIPNPANTPHDTILTAEVSSSVCEECRRSEDEDVWAEVLRANLEPGVVRSWDVAVEGSEGARSTRMGRETQASQGITVRIDPAICHSFPPVAGANPAPGMVMGLGQAAASSETNAHMGNHPAMSDASRAQLAGFAIVAVKPFGTSHVRSRNDTGVAVDEARLANIAIAAGKPFKTSNIRAGALPAKRVHLEKTGAEAAMEKEKASTSTSTSMSTAVPYTGGLGMLVMAKVGCGCGKDEEAGMEHSRKSDEAMIGKTAEKQGDGVEVQHKPEKKGGKKEKGELDAKVKAGRDRSLLSKL